MRKITLNGQTLEVSDEVAAALAKGGNNKTPSLEEVVKKHPWIKPFAGNGLQQIPSGNGNFKFGIKVKCQAGKLVETTTRYVGKDSVTPTRIDMGESKLRTYNYSTLEPCDVEMVKATSDLHQSHLCPGCKKTLESTSKAVFAQLAKALTEEAQAKQPSVEQIDAKVDAE